MKPPLERNLFNSLSKIRKKGLKATSRTIHSPKRKLKKPQALIWKPAKIAKVILLPKRMISKSLTKSKLQNSLQKLIKKKNRLKYYSKEAYQLILMLKTKTSKFLCTMVSHLQLLSTNLTFRTTITNFTLFRSLNQKLIRTTFTSLPDGDELE